MGNYNLEIMPNKKIAICDCNNFYVSCERLFNPELISKPVAVLSNNDGCVIARSQEVKDMGVKMGQPLFKLDAEIKSKMKNFSSNYVLYGDISDRISNILRRYTDKLEVYSIDESFLDLSHIPDDEILNYIKVIKSEVFRLTGIPVSIGVAPNKTLAKLMNFLSKTKPELAGTCTLWDGHNVDEIEVDEVWGIGRKWKKKLLELDIKTVGQFKQLDQYVVRRMFTIVGLRTWLELNGDLIFSVETGFKKPKVVTSSRSFGRTVWQREQVEDAIWTFIEDCSKKLKVEGLKAKTAVVFCATNRFQEDYFVWSKKINLFKPSNDIDSLYNEIGVHLDEIPMKLWAKAGVMFFNLIDDNIELPKLFEEKFPERKRPTVMSQLWMTRRDFLSPKWTTEWSDVPKLK